MTVQLNEIRPKNQKPMMLKKLKKIPLFLSKKYVIPPYSHQILECSLCENSESFKECSGVVLPNQEFENSAEVAMTSSLSTIDEKGKVLVSAVNITDHYIHVMWVHVDVGYNTELMIKLTPEHDLTVYVQSPITPIHLRDELIVELALMHYYNLITTLPHSKYSSPVFAQRKSSGRLRILIDLRRINHLLRNDFINSNFPISNMSDASNHFAGKKFLNKLDCSQAYDCVQMADDLSIQLLAFNFASRTYAYKCLAQGLSKSMTGFSSFIRHYLDQCLAANICTQYMDYIGSGVETFEELIPNLRQIFECVRKSGLKLSPGKCEFGVQKITFLGKVITPAGIQPERERIKKFMNKLTMPRTVKQVKRLVGFLQFWRDFIPNLSEKLLPFYKLLRKNVEHYITEEQEEALEFLKEALQKAIELTLR